MDASQRLSKSVNSISLRLLLGATIWIVIGLALASLLILQQVKTYSEAVFDEDLHEEATALITAAGLNIDGQLSFTAPIQSQRFYRPFSGWYWQINLNNQTVATSRSLWDQTLDINAALKDPEGVAREMLGPRGERLRARQVFSKIDEGELFILVAGNSEGMLALQRSIARLLLVLSPLLTLLMLGLTFLQIRFGLRPLRALTNELRKLRDGDTENLNRSYPREIQPLADEINSLQSANIELVERARRQVGNLAHAIKTPLSVMRNAADASDTDLAAKAQSQAILIQDQIDRHLSIARSAATSKRRGELLNVEEIGGSIQKALSKIHADKGINFQMQIAAEARPRADKADMTEMLGNLMENAAKWCKSHILLSGEVIQADGKAEVYVCVEDDGPGVPASRRAEAMERGKRLDERTPGTGLGLSIVNEMAEMHGGKLVLKDSDLGGLRAELRFPFTD